MKQWLEARLTRVPMYRLVIFALLGIHSAALGLSFFGLLPFQPLALIISTALFVISGVAASYLLGKVYGAPSHLSSAVITSLILALLFNPTTNMGTLALFVLISVIAQASKYVIVLHQRHIFNPVAFGAFVGGILQLQFASWWVGSPPLLGFVALASFVVLYKTRQLSLGLVMVAVSCTILTATGLIRGEPLFATIWMSVSSWPVIFLAGFMLSEPLTLPPRHWQKVFVAITTALVFSLPFHVGWFTSSPEFALLVGNVVAFVVARKQRSAIVLTLVKRQALTPTVDEFVFSLEKPAVFEPGQFIELTVPHKSDSRGIRRSFSITSVPGRNKISLGVKFYHPSSTFKKHLRQLKIGEKVMTTGITGDFVLPKDTSRKILLIAGGIGVTPFISHIIADGSRRDIQVLYFIRDKQEAAYKSILDESHAQVTYFVADDSSVDEAFQPGAHLTAEIINTYVKDLTERDVYISGPPAMVDATKKLASRAKTIHTDYFSGY